VYCLHRLLDRLPIHVCFCVHVNFSYPPKLTSKICCCCGLFCVAKICTAFPLFYPSSTILLAISVPPNSRFRIVVALDFLLVAPGMLSLLCVALACYFSQKLLNCMKQNNPTAVSAHVHVCM